MACHGKATLDMAWHLRWASQEPTSSSYREDVENHRRSRLVQRQEWKHLPYLYCHELRNPSRRPVLIANKSCETGSTRRRRGLEIVPRPHSWFNIVERPCQSDDFSRSKRRIYPDRCRDIVMSIDVCEGCRRLRKRCDKDDCVLQPCLESLWRNNKLYQGNATVFLAKYFGRKRFFELLQDVTKDERPALFQSLLHEACGRTVNPVSGAIGLKTSNRWHLCEEAVVNVLTGRSLNPVGVVSDTPSASTSSSSCPLWIVKAKRERDGDETDVIRLPQLVAESRARRRHQNLDFDLNLDLNLGLQQVYYEEF